jgi:hypothetical protein
MSIFILNNNAVFPNADGLINQQTAKILYSGSPIGKSNPISGIIDGCRIRNLSYIQESSSRVQNNNPSELNITLNSNSTLEARFIGITPSYGLENFSRGVLFIGTLFGGTQSKDISGTYKINSLLTQTLGNQPVSKNINIQPYTQSGVLSGLTGSSTFSFDSFIQPQIFTLNKLQIKNSKIYSGFFKRALLESNDFNSEQEDLPIDDREKVAKLRISNTILSKTNNFIQTTIHKSIVTSANLVSGLVNNSIWQNTKFLSGIFNNSTWLSGTFSGKFLSSYTYSSSPISFNTLYKGWYDGKFLSGDFEKSLWIDGEFSSGNFYSSDWLSGTLSGGSIGSENLKANQTTFGNLPNTTGYGRTSSTWINGVVKNAIVGGSSFVDWQSGNFNSGELLGNTGYFTTWKDGIFNSGRITGNVIWQGGNFNNGSFNSTWGLGSSLTASDHFAWQGGRFNSGIFGSGDGQTNSSWWDGEFWGGVFKGKLWNGGNFYGGDFIGGYTPSVLSDEQSARDYFTGSYWGLWRNGLVIDNSNVGVTQRNIFTPLNVVSNLGNLSRANFQNMLWIDGTFSHDVGVIFNSLWLQGRFVKGNFRSSSFNPWVNRVGLVSGETSSSSFNLTQSCIWKGGNFIDSNFYISEWEDGVFQSGTMTAGIWHSGIWEYGFANNILWKGGRWRNGNWNGSPFTSSSSILSNSQTAIYLKRINSFISPTSDMFDKVHYINVGSFSVSPTEIINFTFSSTSTEYYTQSSNVSLTDWTLSSSALISSGSLPPLQFSEHLIPQVWECDETLCRISRNIFRDTSFTYQITIRAKCDRAIVNPGDPTYVYLFAKIGSFTQSQILPDSGGEGYWSGNFPSFTPISTSPIPTNYAIGTPIIHLSNSFFTYSFEYSPKTSDDKDFTLQAYNFNPGISVGVEVQNISIRKVISNYNDTYNNKLTNSSTSTSPNIPFLPVPNSSYQTPSDNGSIVSMNFGNGLFEKGIWENGVWNNGWRGDEYSWTFSSISNFIQTGQFTYTIRIEGLNSQNFIVGERISISNIVGIDVNQKFSLIKSSGVILEKVSNYIRVEFVSNTLLRSIVKDSPDHPIKVSKNVWLSGAFLNGYFSGIMLYGLVNGYPKNLLMESTHLVDGVFVGGQISDSGTEKCLIQSLKFSDGSYLVQPDKLDPNYSTNYKTPLRMLGARNRRYNSWINLTWNQNQRSNTYDNLDYFSEFFDKSIKYLNHTSYTTDNILRTSSIIRNISNTRLSSFSLGKKFSPTTSKIQQSGQFNYVTNIKSGVPQTSNNSNLLEFFSRGWTYSYSLNNIFDLQSSTFSSNYNVTDPDFSNLLLIETTASASGTGFSSWNFSNNNSAISRERYSLVEFEVYTHSGSTKVDFVNFGTSSNKYPRIYLNNKPINNLANLLSTPVDHLSYTSSVKREYFFNLEKLDFSILAGSDFDSGWTSPSSQIYFSRINFYEIDSIPFFNYYLDSTGGDRIDRFMKSPTKAIAPRIDYNLIDFDFIGNVQIYR